jgi:hypothetical protein
LGYEPGVEKRAAIADVTSPLARRLLAMVAILSIAVTGVATAVTFVFVQRRRRRPDAPPGRICRRAGQDRGPPVLRPGQGARGGGRLPGAPLAMALDPRTVDASSTPSSPEQGDGTRRSVDGLFTAADGRPTTPTASAAICATPTPDPAGEGLFVAATQVVAHTGEAELNRYDNFYFFTPNTRLVMFGPQSARQADVLSSQGPADLRHQRRGDDPPDPAGAEPERVMKCTKLRKLMSDPSGRGLNSACMTPFDYNGQQLGAWGTSLSLDSYLLRAVEDALPGGRNMIVSSDGELIAAPKAWPRTASSTPRPWCGFRPEEGVADVVRQIRALGATSAPSAPGDRLIAYGRLKEPDWYFLMSFPSGDMVWSAVKTASWVLLFGVLGVIIQVALLYRLMRQTVERPLRGAGRGPPHRRCRRGRADRGSHRRDRRPGPHPARASATAISSCCARWRSASPSAPPSWSAPTRPSRCSWPTCPTSCARR